MVDILNKCLSAMVDDHHNPIWCDNLYLLKQRISLDQHQTLTFECMHGTIHVWFFALWDNFHPMVRLVNNVRSNHSNCVDTCTRDEMFIKIGTPWVDMWKFTNNFGSRLRLIVPSTLANCTSTSSSPAEWVNFNDDGGGRNGAGLDCTSDEL